MSPRCDFYKTMDDVISDLSKGLGIGDGPTKTSANALFIQLRKCENNGERVKTCYQLLHDYKCFPPKPNDEKCDLLSAKYRKMGNDFFRREQDPKQAMHNYNLALTYAQSSRLLSMAFANRSAVLLSLKKYKECLVDIERALSSGYDEDLKPKLIKRKLFCEEQIAVDSSSPSQFELERQNMFPFPENTLKNVPCASSLLEITHTQSTGRCVIAAEDISPGEVLAVEEPYMIVLLQKYYLARCYSCCNLNDVMIPCEHCRYVMFCDEACRAKSWNSAHKFECPLMPLLISMKFTSYELLSLRTMLRARCDHSSWDEMFDTIRRAESETDPKLKGFVNVPSADGSSEDSTVYDSKHYATIHMFKSNFRSRTEPDIFTRGITAAVFLRMLYKYTSFFDDCPIPYDMEITSKWLEADNYVWAAGGLLLHHNMTAASNVQSVATVMEGENRQSENDAIFADGAYPFLSLINHSCPPNTTHHVFNNTITLVALKPIKRGQQIFDSYGYNRAAEDYETCQRELYLHYKFVGACETCSNRWLPYDYLKKVCHISKTVKTPQFISYLRMSVAYKYKRL